MSAQQAVFQCPICVSGKIEIPIFRIDVQSWEHELIECPLCKGRVWLSAAEWDNRRLSLIAERTIIIDGMSFLVLDGITIEMKRDN